MHPGHEETRSDIRVTAITPPSSTPCLLCAHADTRLLQRIPASRLAHAYRAEFGIGVDFAVDEILYAECARCGLLFFAPPITGDEAFYGELQKISWYYRAAKPEFRLAAAYVRATHHVLEIGAGRGLFAQEIAPASYTGLEFSPVAIELAAQSGIRLLPETVERHAHDNAERYDIVCAFQVLEHVAAPRGFIDAAVKCLRPGGKLMLSVPAQDSFAAFAYWDVLNMPPHHVTRWTDACLRSVADLCGLRFVALTPEPLGRNMSNFYARSMVDHWLARRLKFAPGLIDERVKAPMFRLAAMTAVAFYRRHVRMSLGGRRGQAILAVFEK